MQFAFHVLTLFCIAATVVSSLRLPRWWVKGWDVGRAHLAWLMSILFILGLVYFPLNILWVQAYLLSLLVSIAYHLKVISPFTPLYKVEVERTDKSNAAIKFLTANVREKNKEYHRLINLIEKVQPDIFFLTETNQEWLDAVIHFNKEYPHTIFQAQENTYGMLFFSKHTLKNTEIKFLVEHDVPSFHTNIQFKGKVIQFLGMHPRPPAPTNDAKLKDLELIKIAGMTNENHLPTIIGGDLNDVGWSRITQNFKMISGLKDPRVGRGFFNTYNALIPIFRVPIDHFFVSKEFKLIQIKRLEKVGSDHFPVLLEVNLEE